MNVAHTIDDLDDIEVPPDPACDLCHGEGIILISTQRYEYDEPCPRCWDGLR